MINLDNVTITAGDLIAECERRTALEQRRMKEIDETISKFFHLPPGYPGTAVRNAHRSYKEQLIAFSEECLAIRNSMDQWVNTTTQLRKHMANIIQDRLNTDTVHSEMPTWEQVDGHWNHHKVEALTGSNGPIMFKVSEGWRQDALTANGRSIAEAFYNLICKIDSEHGDNNAPK